MKTISKHDYYSAVGLGQLAKDKNAELKTIEEALAKLMGVEDEGYGYYGHVSDFVYNDSDIKTLLKNLEIKVLNK